VGQGFNSNGARTIHLAPRPSDAVACSLVHRTIRHAESLRGFVQL